MKGYIHFMMQDSTEYNFNIDSDKTLTEHLNEISNANFFANYYSDEDKGIANGSFTINMKYVKYYEIVEYTNKQEKEESNEKI